MKKEETSLTERYGMPLLQVNEKVFLTEKEIKDFLKPLLAPFKQPRKIYFMEKLPRNATGKILKRELRELANSSENMV
mgnify:CR=1 FL=1